MTRFAAGTEVPVERTRAQIEDLLRKHHASAFASAWDGTSSVVQFELRKRWIRFVVTMPKVEDFRRSGERRVRVRTADQTERAWEQACRERWRALLLVIRAKLESVESGIASVEQEFLAWMVTADGQTVGSKLLGDIDKQLHRGPLLLLAGGAS